ncbi:multicopper oxidase domain-containing protein [Granulicella arctica]|uniref:multicopper oxidase domain-containing protein n=1 Tax=Granulicella arctica TaxID=940613 RepID=UPI0021DF5E1E|nr:multicopper oxidase domain-containing protein [Granulicella arctica]
MSYLGLRYVTMLSLIFASFPAMSVRAHAQMHAHSAPPAVSASQSRDAVATKDVPPGVIRIYFIAAEEVDWDYSPKGKNLAGVPHTENEDDESGGSVHRVYHKAVYKEYTDATFKTLKTRPQQWEHLGLLGPLIRAEVGDTVRVTFKNNTHLSVTMHPHGLEYKKDAEGALYQDGTPQSAKADDKITPGGTYVYLWTVPESSGPAEMDGSSVLWMYHSHFVESTDINTGLVGPIIVTARGKARPDGSPKDVDREFITDFSIFDETNSWFSEKNTSRQPNFRNSANDPVFLKQNTLYSINGYIEANMPLVTMRKGERVRWYLLSNSNENDIHMAHWHGNTVVWNKMRMDSVFLGPMAMAIADMVPANEGIWLFHCHVGEHFLGGMVGRYQVLP